MVGQQKFWSVSKHHELKLHCRGSFKLNFVLDKLCLLKCNRGVLRRANTKLVFYLSLDFSNRKFNL